MPQLNIYVPEAMAKELRQRARREKKSLSALVVGLIEERTPKDSWPAGFFEDVIGRWAGKFPRVERRPPEERDEL